MSPSYSHDQAVVALSALAQTTRLQIYRALTQAGPQGRPAGELALQLGVSPATLSFHLKELSNAGLIWADREGRSLIYKAHFGQMRDLLDYLLDNCCEGQACEAQPSERSTC